MARPRSRKTTRLPKRPAQRFCQEYVELDGLQVVHRQAAGIDIGGALSHFVAIETRPGVIEVREFGCNTNDLYALRDYLRAHAITTVALESTGVYWIPPYDILTEAGIEVYLVNPSHVKNVPGRRKDDKLDCKWLLKLHTYGLLSASFRPSAELLPLRTFWRLRLQLVQLQADEIRRMQKALDEMNVRVHKVITDLVGVTGQAIITAILQGERRPEVLATYRDRRTACSAEELREALTGHYRPEKVFQLKQAYERFQQYQQQIADCDTEVEALLKTLIPLADDDIAAKVQQASQPQRRTASQVRRHLPTYDLGQYLNLLLGVDATTEPGLGPILVMTVVSELGVDMSPWPTVKHFGSYLTLAPQHQISGGKILANATRKGAQRAALAFRQAAAVVARTDTALGAFYRRLALRIGSAKALVATAYKIARMYYYLLKEGRAYVDAGAAAYEEHYRAQQLKSLERHAKALGYQVIPVAA